MLLGDGEAAVAEAGRDGLGESTGLDGQRRVKAAQTVSANTGDIGLFAKPTHGCQHDLTLLRNSGYLRCKKMRCWVLTLDLPLQIGPDKLRNAQMAARIGGLPAINPQNPAVII